MESDQESQHIENQEVKSCDLKLDTVYKVADEVLPTPGHCCFLMLTNKQVEDAIFKVTILFVIS